MPLTTQQILGSSPIQSQPVKPLSDLINANDLARLPAEKSNGFELDPTLIPNVMHYIYVVNPIQDNKQLDLIKQFKEKNPDFQAVLWIDTKAYKPSEL